MEIALLAGLVAIIASLAILIVVKFVKAEADAKRFETEMV